MDVRQIPLLERHRRREFTPIIEGNPIGETEGGEYNPRAILGFAQITRRILAVSIDFALLTAVYYLGLHIAIGDRLDHIPLFSYPFDVGFIFGFWLYESLMTCSAMQATVGKYFCNIRVTDENGARLTFFKASLRHIYRYSSILSLGIGLLLMGFNNSRQTMHDVMAKTLVWRLSPPPLPKMFQFKLVTTEKFSLEAD